MHGYMYSLLFNYVKLFSLTNNMDGKYDENDYDLFFSHIIQ